MPTRTINSENAKQIRQRMEVYISLMAGSGETLTYSMPQGYTYKVGDANRLADTAIQMRALADLQGDGFALDGKCVLYDASTPASSETGKIGVRSNIGVSTAVKVSCSKKVENISIRVSGCDYATYSGTTYDATAGVVIIPIRAYQATIVFHPEAAGKRIEISNIIAGIVIDITHETLVSCKAALRADLSTLDPSLPSSDIEIVAYHPNDVAEIVSNVQDDTPVTYYAGYPGDYSEERRFYLSEQIRWKDNAITIKAEDEGKKLEVETFPIFIGHEWNGKYWVDKVNGAHWHLYKMLEEQLTLSGIHLTRKENAPARTASSGVRARNVASIIERQSQKDLVANMMNLLHQDYQPGYFEGIDSFWLTYVDAGRPSLTWQKPTPKWDIYEEDCGDIVRDVERRYKELTFPVKTVRSTGFTTVKNGSTGTAFEDSGVAAEYEDYTSMVRLQYDAGQWNNIQHLIYDFFVSDYDENNCMPFSHSGSVEPGVAAFEDDVYGKWLFDKGIADNRKLTGWEWTNYTFPEWNWLMQNAWDGLMNAGKIDSSDSSLSLTAVGKGYKLSEESLTYSQSGQGISAEASKTTWAGKIYAGKTGSSASLQILPAEGMKSLLNRSNIKGSFTWKGDPRMQPRDVFNFHRLDGTVEVCTIEQIDLQHVGGGTTANIVYRKGIV